MADATFSTSGLASGIDTASIVDKLYQLESRPLTQLQTRQKAFKVQVSALADIMGGLASLKSAVSSLATSGVLGNQVVSTNDSFSATAGSTAQAGRYAVRVVAMAQAAKWRSTAYASADAPVAGGTLNLTVQGKTYDPIVIQDQTSLADVAAAIRASGAPISATVLSDGTRSYLSVSARDTGFPLTGAAGDALGMTFAADAGATGLAPGFAQIQGALNSQVSVDGLLMTRQSNTIADAIPGMTLSLKATATTAEDLVVTTDQTGTQANLQKLVDAYNSVMKMLQRQLNVTKDTDRDSTLVGNSAVRALQGRLQALTSTSFLATGTVRTLADLGIKTAQDGTLSIDSTVLGTAVTRDPAAVNALFSTATTGLSDTVSALVDAQTRAGDGALTASQDGINASIKQMDDQAAAMQLRLTSYRDNLLRQFAAMEKTVSDIKSVGNFLTTQSSYSTK